MATMLEAQNFSAEISTDESGSAFIGHVETLPALYSL